MPITGRRYLGHIGVDVGYTLTLAFRKSQEQEQDLFFLLSIESANHAKVQQGEASIVGQQNIAWMRIAVERAVDHHLLDVSREQLLGNGDRIDAAQFAIGYLRQVSSVEKTDGEHLARDIIGVDLRRDQVRELAHALAHEPGVVRL